MEIALSIFPLLSCPLPLSGWQLTAPWRHLLPGRCFLGEQKLLPAGTTTNKKGEAARSYLPFPFALSDGQDFDLDAKGLSQDELLKFIPRERELSIVDRECD